MARIPVYRRIEEDLRSQITRGELPALSQFPSETALAAKYGVSRMTVRYALDQLESSRLIVRRQGSGSFVAETPVQGRMTNRLQSFAEELARQDVKVSSRVLSRETVSEPPEDVRSALQLSDGQQVNRITRVRLVDDVPAAYQDAWIPYVVAPGLIHDEFIEGSLYRTLNDRYGVEFGWADQYVVAVLLDEAIAGQLGVDAGSPAMETRRTTFSESHTRVEFVKSWTRSEFPLIVRLEAR